MSPPGGWAQYLNQVGELHRQISSCDHLLLPSHPAAHDFPAGVKNGNNVACIFHFFQDFLNYSHHLFWPGKASVSETEKYSSWVWHKGGGGGLSKTGGNFHIFSEIVRVCHNVLSGEGWAPWFETRPTGLDWSLLPAGPKTFLNFLNAFSWSHQQLGFRYK